MQNGLVGVICVLYFPQKNKLRDLVLNLEKEFDEIIFVDNTPEFENDYLAKKAIESKTKLFYLPLRENKGIAEAQNLGVEKAKERINPEFLVFLDQDSEIKEGFVCDMIREYKFLEQKKYSIAALGPSTVNKDTFIRYKQKKEKFNNGFCEVPFLISSGMLVKMENLNQIGYLESGLFIDLVDFEWCWRAKSLGFSCFLTQKIEMLHKVGIGDKNVFGFPILISSPERYFYQYRNFFMLWKRPYVPFNWKIKNLLRKIIYLVYIPLISKKRWAILRNMVKGGIAGISN